MQMNGAIFSEYNKGNEIATPVTLKFLWKKKIPLAS